MWTRAESCMEVRRTTAAQWPHAQGILVLHRGTLATEKANRILFCASHHAAECCVGMSMDSCAVRRMRFRVRRRDIFLFARAMLILLDEERKDHIAAAIFFFLMLSLRMTMQLYCRLPADLGNGDGGSDLRDGGRIRLIVELGGKLSAERNDRALDSRGNCAQCIH